MLEIKKACSDEDSLGDLGMADLQKSLGRVVRAKRVQARDEQLALFQVFYCI